MTTSYRPTFSTMLLASVFLGACGQGVEVAGTGADANVQRAELATQVRAALDAASGGRGAQAFMLPGSNDLAAIPQDPLNPLTSEKVALGRMLFHDTAFALGGRGSESQSWSCATCHHAAAGFKSGVPQGIGEGGIGFGPGGADRLLDHGFDGSVAADDPRLPDLQPVASPTVLNSAYQSVMLWNGQFGNGAAGPNADVDTARLMTPGTPKATNEMGLQGLEVQAIAGLTVHRMRVEPDTVLQTNPAYRTMWDAAFPTGSTDITVDAGKAIAAYERTLLATQAPFQQFLRGDDASMSDAGLRGALLFFGDAGCAACHTGPALSSWPQATDDQIFFNVGMADLDVADARVHGTVNDATSRGRGGLTGRAGDDYRFKVPPLYNLSDSGVFGHGASFSSTRQVLEYKNAARAQSADASATLDSRFAPLALAPEQIDDLEQFLLFGLHDDALDRFTPDSVPSGHCVSVDSFDSLVQGDC